MNRKTFIGTIATGIGALFNVPEKANAVVAAVARENRTPDQPMPPTGAKEGNMRCDPDGKVYRLIKGEWVHVATAMPEGTNKRS